MTRFRYAVTFESDGLRPDTIRGEIEASEAPGAARKALVKAFAHRMNPRNRWRSVSILLDRADEPDTPPSSSIKLAGEDG